VTKAAKHGASGEVRVVERAPIPAIRMIGATASDGQAPLRWSLLLVWFMRTMAVVWISKGLFAWAIALGVDHDIADALGIHSVLADFLELPVVTQGMIGFVAVADLLAAVGLWLAAPWGGVLWLICASTEVMAATLGAGAALTGPLGVALDGVLIVVYFVLSWLAANERA
jgi:hypothetical protein